MYDAIGAGLGPANMALLTAVEERRLGGAEVPAVLVLEAHAEFNWHAGMLLPRARCQVSFLKDLATMRNPTSPFTFVNYLHQHGRLAAFLNLRDTMPSRVEFNHYLRWVAEQVGGLVRYGERVERVEPVAGPGGEVTALAVHARELASGAERTYLARHL
ncbi:MAG TPA: SidA/IucD/PvdA family monooxygenase [Micromonosporaceae bacterium]|nr:SidA/IucD/PvdA family monooxygenase [Micromonosporaceae bacterium]